MTSYDVSGLPVTTQSFDEILQDMDEKISNASGRHYISITNTESMYHALRNEAHKSFIMNADHSCCDGIGVVIAGMFWGKKVPRRNGPILMLKACEYGLDKSWRHYFYGGKEGVADKLKVMLSEEYPGLNVAGTYCPPFGQLSEQEKQAVIDDIKKAKADIIWVGLGLVKQEAWIAEFLSEVNVPWMVGVGAAFDYHTGEVPWAPKWVQAIGMEWLYRTIVQPRIRIKRYIWSFHFMFESIFDAVVTRSTKFFR